MLLEYPNFAALAAAEVEGVDFDRVVRPRPGARAAVIAPHGGRIEPRTDDIALAIAGGDFSLYCFCSRRPRGGTSLHITSRNFDDPRCLDLVARHQWVVAIHGCKESGQRILLGGRDAALIADLAHGLGEVGLAAETSGHEFPATDETNICNRGATGAGAQCELSMEFRRSAASALFVGVVREVLLARQTAV